MRFQERQKTKYHSDQQGSHSGSHLKAFVRHLGYLRLSGLQPGRVVVVTSSFSDGIVFAVQTRKNSVFKTVPFSNRSTLESVFELIRFR